MAEQREDLTRLTAELTAGLVAVDSINPSLVPGAAGEGPIAEVIAGFLRERGFAVTLEEGAPGRPTPVGVRPGAVAPGEPLLMLNGHIDTVDVAAMPGDPFDPHPEGTRRDGRLYGRGAYDMKGGVAATLAAGATLAARPGRLRGTLLVTCSADEEYASIGSEALAAGLRDGTIPGVPRLPQQAAAILTEPTGEEVTIAHKGFAWLRVTTHGRAAHGSDYRNGVDAIARMGPVLTGLAALDAEYLPRTAHPLLGRPSVHASTIAGGRGLSTYPDVCTLEIERRTLPGETREGVANELAALLDEAGGGVRRRAARARAFLSA